MLLCISANIAPIQNLSNLASLKLLFNIRKGIALENFKNYLCHLKDFSEQYLFL